MIKTVLEGENRLVSLVMANITLGGFQHFVEKVTPILSFLLLVLQIAAATATVIHIVKKWIRARKEK
jgi:hypothetical protein